MSGYESRQAFTDVFKAMYKTSPAEFRETENFYPLQLEIYLKKEHVKAAPFYCPKYRQERLIEVRNLRVAAVGKRMEMWLQKITEKERKYKSDYAILNGREVKGWNG